MIILTYVNEIYNLIFDFINNNIISFISNIQFIISAIVLISIIIISIVSAVIFEKTNNKKTIQCLEQFKMNGKYIDGLFVEIDNTKEFLRCFVFGKKTKQKIVNDHNEFIKSHKFQTIEKKIQYKFKIKAFKNRKQIIKKVQNNKNIVSKYSNLDKNDDHYFSFYVYRATKYDYDNLLENTNIKINLMSSGSLILVGNAGNGKTTLLCNIAQLLIKNNCPCTYINSRDVEGNLKQHFLTSLQIPNIIKNKNSLFLWILDFCLKIVRKQYIIMVDALNENDKENFVQSISDFNNFIHKYKRVKVIYSCRNEYYKMRYEKYFQSNDKKPYEITLDNSFISDRAKNKVMAVYRNYFNYSGNISEYSKEKMFKSMLLMRMFFEVNKNKSNNTEQMYNYVIYSEYIKKIDNQLSEIKLTDILDNIADKMIEISQFDSIDENLIDYPVTEINKILDNNLIISKTILKNKEQITQTEINKICFTFDEIRDYYLARRIIDKCETESDYSKFFELCDLLYSNTLSPTEGVLKYSYFHLIKNKRMEEASRLLFEYNDYQNTDRMNYLNRTIFNITYTNLGLSMIMDCPRTSDFVDFEEKYILFCANESRACFFELLCNLIYNEVNGYNPNLTILIETVLNKNSDINKIQQYLKLEFFSYYSYNGLCASDTYEQFKDFIDNAKDIIKNDDNLKQIIIILASIIKEDDYFELLLDHEESLIIIEDLLSKCKNKLLIQFIENYKSNVAKQLEINKNINEHVKRIYKN